MDNCVICSIVVGTTNSYSVFEDDDYIAFLDIRPVFLGHCLVAPKKHILTFYDLPANQIQAYFSVVQKIGKAVEKAVQAQGSFIAMNNIVSQSIPHLHTHVVPRNPKDGLKGFFWPRMRYESEQQMQEIQTQIKTALSR